MGDWVGFQSFLIKIVQFGKKEKVKKFREKDKWIFHKWGKKDLLIFEWNLQNGFYILFIFKN